MKRREIVRRAGARDCALPADLHPVLRRVYAARGVGAASDLTLGLRNLLPVTSLEGIEAGVSLLLDHLERGSRVLVVGDYDADGATSTALILRQLQRLGFGNVGFRVPDRMRHGYGLTAGLVEELVAERPGLLVTVDNGVAAHGGIEAARTHGMQVLVTDHHLPGASLPAADVMINPNLRESGFASKALAGVGVAFYLMAALTRRLEERDGTRKPAVADLLDLVALGTVADLVCLDRNNRILVDEGLKRIRAGRAAAGVLALAEVAGRRVEGMTARDLGFSLAPRLNAAGRIDDMTVGIRCLVSDDPREAGALAGQLHQLNRDRRDIEDRMRTEAVEILRRIRIEEGSLPPGVALFDEAWHPGVVGLVASRIKERVHRPVAAFAPADGGELRGSVRSVEGVHVRDVLEAIDARQPGLIHRFGGHAMAAGLTLERGCFRRFAEAFGEEVGRWLSAEQMRGVIESDGELSAAELNLETAVALREGGPWGQGFPEPLFDGEFHVVESRVVGQTHLKFWARPRGEGQPVEGIAFGYYAESGAPRVEAGSRLHMAYRLDTSDFGGRLKPEIKAESVEAVDTA
jgi:single-stranded-DNA-specific exonuclease